MLHCNVSHRSSVMSYIVALGLAARLRSVVVIDHCVIVHRVVNCCSR
jgi:hypothetical protein